MPQKTFSRTKMGYKRYLPTELSSSASNEATIVVTVIRKCVRFFYVLLRKINSPKRCTSTPNPIKMVA